MLLDEIYDPLVALAMTQARSLRFIMGRETWAAFRALALRWMIYSRTGIPLWPFGMPAMVLMLAFHVTVIAAIIAGWLGTVIWAALFTPLRSPSRWRSRPCGADRVPHRSRCGWCGRFPWSSG